MKSLMTLIIVVFSVFSQNILGQCGRISLIGEFNEWNADEFMKRNPVDPAEFSLVIVLTLQDDYNGDGIVEMKFRENGDWVNNWGSVQFPSGTGILNGPNIPVPVGSYLVTFNCLTLVYNFQETCGGISLIGEFSGWVIDHKMTRNPLNPDLWITYISLNEESNQYDPPDIIEMKFRENNDWTVNWGSLSFPSGTGVQGGANIPVPLTTSGITTDYKVSFNCATGEYTFQETCGEISIMGEFNGWTNDHFMTRDPVNLDLWTTYISLDEGSNQYDPPDIIEMKFRENGDWAVNWGSLSFPSGIAVQDGPNIPVPLTTSGITTDYKVVFNYTTGAFNFIETSGTIGIIGAFLEWNSDILMNRDPDFPDEWSLTRRWYEDSEVKFRENQNWTNNWGGTTFPAGTGTSNGPNIPLVAGTYDINFNALTGAYNFVNNPDACGEIGLVGDFNGWGFGTGSVPTDVWMVRDPLYPNQFSIDYTFAGSTGLLFRMDADPTFENAWGGASLCQNGVKDPSLIIPVPVGNYHITFDGNSGDYCLTRLSNHTTASKVFSMVIDGELGEPDWDIDQQISRMVEGFTGFDPNEGSFDVCYNDSFLYIGLEVTDTYVNPGDIAEFFIDGNNSGGGYDEHDVYFTIDGLGELNVIIGPQPVISIEWTFETITNGYVMEVAVPWDDLDVTPLEGNIFRFDIMLGDDDFGFVEYHLAWNGSMTNVSNTSEFGYVTFGPLKCGCITLYNPELGDINLRNPTDLPNDYVATYEFDADFGVVFRKDKADFVTWGSEEFPAGTAELGGPQIPAVTGRYRINFNCLTGVYTFENTPSGDNVALADYTEDAPVIDGQLDEYNLSYGCNILVAGTGPINNMVYWGTRWDLENLYIGAQVTDEALYGSGSPWDNDALEFYIDGNNDKDGTYDGDFDTQVILDYLNQSVPWFKPDGVPITNYQSAWVLTGLGYNVEMRLGWDNFDFAPGRGRVIGWSLGNDDNDYNAGRDYQSVWYGTINNWNNTSDLGDLELANGPYTLIPERSIQGDILVYPNPSGGAFYVLLKGSVTGDRVNILVSDMSGRLLLNELEHVKGGSGLFIVDLGQADPGIYIVRVFLDNGNYYTQKFIIR